MPLLEVRPIKGHHCESTTLVHLLGHEGVDLSEPMVFGLASGLSFVYWHAKNMEFPMLGGRCRPDALTTNLAEVMNLDLDVKETRSDKRAWDNLVSAIDAGKLVGLKLDSHYLDYADHEFHFAGHYATCTGYDDEVVYLLDTMCDEPEQTTTHESLREARSFRGPMASPNRSITIDVGTTTPPLGEMAITAINKTATAFLDPPITNMSFKGIHKAAKLMRTWLDDLESPGVQLPEVGMIIEDAGTGGGLFRTMWGNFLHEAAGPTGISELSAVGDRYHQLSQSWTRVSELIIEAGHGLSLAPLDEAADLLVTVAEDERVAMQDLLGLTQ